MANKLVSVKAVKRVTVIDADGEAHTIHKRKKKKKRKQSNLVKPMERMQRRMVQAVQAGAEEYLDRHDKSAREKKDGWVRDMPKNMSKAAEESMKKARKAFPNVSEE